MAGFRELARRVGAIPVRSARPAGLLMHQLKELGWHRSVVEKLSVDVDGEPTPWWTYAATRWLDLVLANRDGCRAFEFGSGASTTWLSRRTSAVLSIEHDPTWHRTLSRTVGANVDLRLVSAPEGSTAAEHEAAYVSAVSEDTFDLVVVDGLHRTACVEAAIRYLAEDGLLLLDDSDRLAYGGAYRLLGEAGFGRVDFFGPRPGVGHLSTTSLFSRHFDAWTRDLTMPVASGY